MNNTFKLAMGVFGVIIPSPGAMCRRPMFVVLPKCQVQRIFCTYTLTSIPLDIYQIYLHDIEHNGLLNSPFSSPAISLLETMLGSKHDNTVVVLNLPTSVASISILMNI